MSDRIIWKIRSVKSYPEAHNHLLVGQVIERDNACIKVFGRSFHFGKLVHRKREVVMGRLATRIIPWSRVEIINELPAGFDFQSARLIEDEQGKVVFSDGENACNIASAQSRPY
ncbi:MAG: hypothetical protein ACLFVU_05755 [Phycisphaerae bacterium]